jgi:hypothetical protein
MEKDMVRKCREKHKKEFKEFKDIKNHWGKKAVEKMQFRGILGGYSDGTFQPDRVLTQGELAVILVRLLDELQPAKDQDRDTDEDQDEDSEELSDVPDWAKFAVKKGFKHKYLNMKRFHSQVQCVRLTAAVAIAHGAELIRSPISTITRSRIEGL